MRGGHQVPDPGLGSVESRARRRTVWAIGMAFLLEKADENVLPATFDSLGAALRATPAQLGVVTFGRNLTMSLLSPVIGLLGHMFDRRIVIASGCLTWGLSTCLMASAGSVATAILLCSINGIGIALVMPSGQSLIADYFSDEQRGAAYGVIGMVQMFGAMFGVVFATNLSGGGMWLGVEGWRIAWAFIGTAGCLLAALVFLMARDPRKTGTSQKSSLQGLAALPSVRPVVLKLRDAVVASKDAILCPSFIVINLQGILGILPFSALTFVVLYLKLLGISSLHCSLIAAAYLAGGAAGVLLGGYVGDMAAKRFPNHGRIAISAISTVLAVPWCCVFFKGLPREGADNHTALYAFVLVFTGLTTTWMGTAGKQPILSEIVPPVDRNLVFALNRCAEGAPAAFAAPIVGWMAEVVFGFKGLATTSDNSGSGGSVPSEGDAVMSDLEKAEALGSAMLAMTAVPWFLCALVWSGLHFTYPRDRRLVAAAVAASRSGPRAAAGSVEMAHAAVTSPRRHRTRDSSEEEPDDDEDVLPLLLQNSQPEPAIRL